MGEMQQLIGGFESISLKEMDSVKLQDRTDTKFVFNTGKLPQVLADLQNHYRLLEVNGVRASRYESLYYDTPGYELYLKHHSGKLNRYKIRYRKYVDSNLHYFEIKFKSNKDRTVKTRIKRKEIEMQINGQSEEFLKEHCPYTGAGLLPQLWVNYTRLTFVSRHDQERVTFDMNLNYIKDDKNTMFDKLIIAELKQERSRGSEFKNIMKRASIREGSISKYCFGINTMVEGIKKNNFKPKMLMMNKIMGIN